MVFNTGAALLDAIVLAVVSREQEEPTGTRLPRMCERRWMCQSLRYIRFFADFRRMNVWKFMTGSLTGGTADIIR